MFFFPCQPSAVLIKSPLEKQFTHVISDWKALSVTRALIIWKMWNLQVPNRPISYLSQTFNDMKTACHADLQSTELFQAISPGDTVLQVAAEPLTSSHTSCL